MEQRYCIKHLKLLRYQGNEIVNQLHDWFKNESFSRTHVYYWIGELNRRCTDLSDALRSGRPHHTYIDDEILAWIKVDTYASCREIASKLGSSGATVHGSLTELEYKNYSLTWVPH